jgi:glycosyltransferase involved in cell wall biosynthesis
VYKAHPDLIPIDPTVGIDHPVSLPYQIFASYSVMNRVYGRSNIDPRWYDAVIPHFFDVKQFEFNPTPKDYFLYVGRIIPSKGISIAIDMAKHAGVKIIIAGVGNVEWCKNPVPDHVIRMGSVDVEQRCELMKNAKAFIAASYYSEPFGMAVVEAMLCGTPVITTDWGGFAETVNHGVTGYRCHTQEQFNWAAKNIDKIDRQACRDWAIKNYSMERIGPMYEEYFDMISRVHMSGGFYYDKPDRNNLDWLKRY